MSAVLNQMAADLFEGGWDGLEVDREAFGADVQKLIDAARAEAHPVAELFGSPLGRHVLLWLVRKTLLRPPSAEMQAATTPEAYALAAKARESQNAVVWMILSALQAAHGEKTGGKDAAS